MITCTVSIGEALDKLSILEIKKTRIADPDKLSNVNFEINSLKKNLETYVDNDHYHNLMIINTFIWDGMEKTTQKLDLILCKEIFSDNDARFRCKNKINTLFDSTIKEVKSYKNSKIILHIPSYPICNQIILSYSKFLSYYYDEVIISKDYKENLVYNIMGGNDNFLYQNKYKPLIQSSDTLNYINSGAMGDLIHILYVIKAMFFITGKRGNLYIAPGFFTRDFNETYHDVKNFITSQIYINRFEMLTENIKIDIDLNRWRYTSPINNWILLLSQTYNVPVMETQWIKWDVVDTKYQNIIIINRSVRRQIK